eukprot:245101_1
MAVKIGRDLYKNRADLKFPLAEHTRLPNEKETDSKDDELAKLPLGTWSYIHIQYHGKHAVDHDIYKKDECHNTVINHSLYLRILFEILTDDKGA